MVYNEVDQEPRPDQAERIATGAHGPQRGGGEIRQYGAGDAEEDLLAAFARRPPLRRRPQPRFAEALAVVAVPLRFARDARTPASGL